MKLVITIDGVDNSMLEDKKHQIVTMVEEFVEEHLLDDETMDSEYDLGDMVSWDTVG